MNLREQGFTILPGVVHADMLDELRDTLFKDDSAGERCLLDHTLVRDTSLVLKQSLTTSGHLPSSTVAIQAISFNKTSATNWKVSWHQDLMFPFANRVASDGFDLPTTKQEIHFARPPESILSRLLAVRLHLDDCDATNGPLNISPGSHRLGVIETTTIPEHVSSLGKIPCLVANGDLLLMRPLCLHASSRAIEPKNRRVLHFVYDSGEPTPEPWHRAIS
jgi:ectoine hydroxylase-related dioxygenase (phytanoyl-CoA dioxygenase family)